MLFKTCKREASETSGQTVKKINCKKTKFKGRQKLLVQIDNFQINKSGLKTVGLRRMLERNMQQCGDYIAREKDKQTNAQFLKVKKKTIGKINEK